MSSQAQFVAVWIVIFIIAALAYWVYLQTALMELNVIRQELGVVLGCKRGDSLSDEDPQHRRMPNDLWFIFAAAMGISVLTLALYAYLTAGL